MQNLPKQEEEEWRPVVGCLDYEVSNLGNVRRATDVIQRHPKSGLLYVVRPKGRPVRDKQCGPYRQVTLYRPDGSRWTVTVHRLVCRAFHGPRPTPDHEVAHWDNVGSNNRSSNLRWATKVENKDDARRHDTVPYGERSPHAKLTAPQVREIRAAVLPKRGQQELLMALAAKHHISFNYIRDIRRGGRRWKHLD